MTDQRTVSPIDGSVYVTRPLATDTEIDAVLDTAVAGHREWRSVALAERIDACRRMVTWMVEHADDIAVELAWQMGRPVRHGPFEIRRGFHERADHMLAIAARALEELELEPKPGFRRFIRREPLGVVLVLAPWNYPFLTAVNAVVPAIVAGNSVVLKVASQTPLVAERWSAAFAAAGIPEGVFQHVHASHDAVARMIGNDRVGFVAFTGSVEGGHAVQRAAAQRFIATGLELGGKDPAYVRADADLEGSIAELVDGSFFNAGQSCCGIERIYVDRRVFHRFLDGFVTLTRDYVLGNPLDDATTLGPMVRADAAAFVRNQTEEAVQKGARALIDPESFAADAPGTAYLAPQILVDVDHSMRVMTEESFGPVVGIMAVEDDDGAVELMNDSAYGLTASVWTADVDAAIAIGDRVETGTWYLNRCDYLDPALAWTGVKDSGRGVTLSALGYQALTRPKSFHLRTAL
ncbi:MAG TPA: aldehyde dehydrogenase family protein [Jatrophihabitantaceae bacterium]|nr:aldehyde dehydrogenase family protein [Jatrophihabitantaceae bacterium]